MQIARRHRGQRASFALDPRARVDHAFDSHHQTALAAKALIGQHYGRPPAYSSFSGCSGGGRQGMMFSQRFPELFDGVIAVAPAMRVSEGATIAAAWTVQKFLQVAPAGPDGRPVELWIIGMGKLGARELNVSSDIDLIYVYEEDGTTAGPQVVSAHEYFAHVARNLYALIGETTDDGIVFRVDLMLRPNGNSGPPAVSLAMLEEYLQVQGREWERFAWLKSRVVAPRASVESGRARALGSIVLAISITLLS